MSFVNELKRRNVLRVGAAYVVISWLLIQVAETIFPLFGFGDTPARLVVIVLAIAFIPSLVFAWVFEITPEGLKRDADVVYEKSISHVTGKKLDRIILIVLALALAYFAFDKFVLDPVRDAEMVEETAQQIRTDVLVESYGDLSIAVLPFVNMSSDPDQEYFSDGISEELLNLLSKIPELRVIARTSSFAYKGKDVKISEIARELDVGHILEGSVRKAGNQVRITAQLIRASDSSHLWSHTYDRNLDNIFAIQDEIAGTVVKQLKVTLPGLAIMTHETDPEAYSLLLQALHLARQESTEASNQSKALFEQVLEITPESAVAWNGLASNYREQTRAGRRPYDEGYLLVRQAAQKALAIDPAYAPAYANLGWWAMDFDGDLASAARLFERALEHEPTNPSVIADAAMLARNLGRLDTAITLLEYTLTRDPLNPADHARLGNAYYFAGRLDEAIAASRTALMLSPELVRANYQICEALLQKGELEAALEVIQQEPQRGYRLIGLALVHYALGQMAESDAALAEIANRFERFAAYNIASIYAFRGEVDLAFVWLNKAVEYKDSGLPHVMINPLFTSVHNDPRWLPFLESIDKSQAQLDAIEFSVTLLE